MSNARSPQHLRPAMVMLTERETLRLRHFIVRVGQVQIARERLGLTKGATFDAARGYGRMLSTTRERILSALDREEAIA